MKYIVVYSRNIYIFFVVVVYLGAGGENRQPAYAPLFSIMKFKTYSPICVQRSENK